MITNLTRAKNFEKEYLRIPKKLHIKFNERITLLMKDPYSPLLNRHRLKGDYLGCESINLTGNYRIIIKWISHEHVHLLRIGTHSKLYKG